MKLSDLEEIHRAPDKATFARRLVAMGHQMDFGIVGTTLVRDMRSLDMAGTYAGNRPASFAPHASDQQLVERDPCVRRLVSDTLPFVYDQAFYVKAGVPELYELAAPHGYRTGINVAIQLPDHQRLIVGVDREEALPKHDGLLVRMMADVQMLAAYCQDVVRRLYDPSPKPSPVPDLSRRECEVLNWVLEGKTSWETGRILSISERTVNLHAQRAARKLGCANKHHAALLALRLHLIG